MLNNFVSDPAKRWPFLTFAWFLSSLGSDVLWKVMSRIMGFDVSEHLATMLVGDSPSGAWIWLFRIVVAVFCGLLIVCLILSLQSKNRTKIKRTQRAIAWSALFAAFTLVSFVSFSAGQDRPSIRTIAELLNPVRGARSERNRFVLEIDSTQLIPYARQFELIGICRVIPDTKVNRGFMGSGKRGDTELQRSGVYPISNPMELQFQMDDGFPLKDGFCRDGGREIECGLRAVTKDEKSQASDFSEADGKLFAHFVTFGNFTEEDRQNLCGG